MTSYLPGSPVQQQDVSWSWQLLASPHYSPGGNIVLFSHIYQVYYPCRTRVANTNLNLSTDTEACVSSLLDTSVRHSPHFDWVVAHLGSCFPHTVTSRVLSLGLRYPLCFLVFQEVIYSAREFAAAASTNPGSAELSLSKIPKLVSVVNILSHLGTTHPIQLEEAVQEAVQVKLEIFRLGQNVV